VVPRQSLRDLEAQITELTGHLNAATYYWLTLIAEFDRREGWGDGATRSCAHWLNWKCGIDLGAARERVRVAHALEELPKISEAMREGRLSYSKVRAITRVATEATEDTFLQIAIHGTAHHVEKLVRVFRRAKEAEELSRGGTAAGAAERHLVPRAGWLVGHQSHAAGGGRGALHQRDGGCGESGTTDIDCSRERRFRGNVA